METTQLRPRRTCRQQRKLCNRVSGVLLLYMLLMNLVILVVMFIQIGSNLIQLGGAGYQLDAAMRKIFSPPLFTQLISNGTGYLLVSCLCLLLILIWKGGSFYKSVFQPVRSMSAAIFLQLLCVFMSVQILSSLFSNVLEAFLNNWGLSAMAALEQASGFDSSATMIVYGAVFAPVAEELLFRGAVLRSFQPFGKRFAIFFSALLFGLFHGNLIQIPFAFLVGLILGYVAVEYSLACSIALHFINNAIFSLLLARVPAVQTILLLLLFVAGVVVFLIHGNDIRRYHRSLLPMPKPAVKGFFTAPFTIILILFCLLNALLGIQSY